MPDALAELLTASGGKKKNQFITFQKNFKPLLRMVQQQLFH